jgi:shikimate kinase
VHGVSRSSAAVTVVNALPTGVGCAVGIERYVTASVDLEPSAVDRLECVPRRAATRLVRASVREATRRFARGRRFHARVHLRSEVPVAKGLKSSSAVATAIVRAVARAVGREPSPLAVARMAAQVGRSVGVSATGALDDALAGLRPGFVLTDNRHDLLLSAAPVPEAWAAVVYVPLGTHPPSPSLRAQFEARRLEGRLAVDEALARRFPEAMRLNTLLVERLMGYRYAGLRERLVAAGAVTAGVSGLGPALAALVPAHREDEVLAALPTDRSLRFAVRLTSEEAP